MRKTCKNEKGITLILLIVIIAILLICISLGIIFIVNNKEDDKMPLMSSDNVTYDGTVELGTPVEFEIKEIKKPEKVGSGWCEINGNSWYYDLDAEGNAINVYVYGDFSGDVTIPDVLDGHKVISIGKNERGMQNTLFHKSLNGERYWNNITSITVPEGVKYINSSAFYAYTNLEKVTLPDSIIYIGDDAFAYSKNLAYINSNIEGKVIMPKNLQYYGESLFRMNNKIKSFEFPEQINYIQDWTFYETSGFTDLTISGQFKYVGYGAFSQSEITTLNIEEGVKIIEKSAFDMNEQLTKVNMANSVVSIGENAFQMCKSINEFKYNGKLTYIGKEVFNYTNLKNVFKKNQLP